MGNCAPKPRSGPRPPPSSPVPKPAAPVVLLYGSESCPVSASVRLALLYKSVPFHFVPCDSPLLGRPFLRCGADTVAGAADDSLLREVDSRFPRPPAAAALAGVGTRRGGPSPVEEVALATALQHRSVERHVARMARWAAEMVAAGGGGRGEAARMGRSYGQLAEVALEHAQMEERLLFPNLEAAADQGVCKAANEEHARDLPIINGIKEDIKSTVAMEAGSPFHQEALLNLTSRFRTLEEHFKEHFREEEEELLPLLETVTRTTQGREGNDATDGTSPSSWMMMEQVMMVMEATHSPRLFAFFMAGLLPEEAVQYIGLVCRYTKDQQRLASMLRSLITFLEAKHTHASSARDVLCLL